MKKYGLDKKTLTQVSTAVNQYSSFGIENTTFKTDYIHLYVITHLIFIYTGPLRVSQKVDLLEY